MEKIEKITIDKQQIKEFVERTKETENWDRLVFFSTEIDGGEFEASLDFNRFEGEDGFYKMYYFGAEAREFFIDEEQISIYGPDVYGGLAFDYIEEIDEEFYETLFEFCQKKTDEYIDTLNKQQELIEQAIKDGVKRFDEDNDETDEFECLADEISDIWSNINLSTYEDSMQSGFLEFKKWLGDFLEQKQNG